MERLTKRNKEGIAYLTIADTLSREEQEIEGSKPILEGIYAVFQRLAHYEDLEELAQMQVNSLYEEDIPFSYNECEECIYTENLQDETRELRKLLDEIMEENKIYKESNERLMTLVEKYDKEMKQ